MARVVALNPRHLSGMIFQLASWKQTPTSAGMRRLIPVQRDEWTEEVNEALWIDEKVSVRVHKVSACSVL